MRMNREKDLKLLYWILDPKHHSRMENVKGKV